MRLAEPITFAVIVLALFVAPVASAGVGPADGVGAASFGQDDDMNETTTEGMDDTSDGTTTDDMSGDGMDDDADDTTQMMDDTTDAGGSSAFAPGFGPVVAIVALAGAALYAVRRE